MGRRGRRAKNPTFCAPAVKYKLNYFECSLLEIEEKLRMRYGTEEKIRQGYKDIIKLLKKMELELAQALKTDK